MRQEIHVNEYYDLFDIKTVSGSISSALTDVPSTIRDTQMTNPFRGFWNNDQYNTQQKPYDIAPITGQIKSPQAQNSLRVETNGDIWCYPPNVSVPYWSRIIFRNYDYNINPQYSSMYLMLSSMASNTIIRNTYPFIENVVDNVPTQVPIPADLWGVDNTDGSIDPNPIFKHDFSDVSGISSTDRFLNFSRIPLFLRFDEYPSRSKVIFSKCDKTRNPDIEFRFAYKKGQMEPIKLNLSLSANVAIRDPSTPANTYNQNLNKATIQSLLKSCYWCIEWIYEPETR